ncbi:MAG: hypothetical protein HYR80_01700, partial [Nitrospirae bacterium]|nr:hypothetical protein [Nitrospirota bacterium]
MKAVKLVQFVLIFVLLGMGVAPARAATTSYSLSDFSALPPFIGNVVTPNILLLLDNSGSMNDTAYGQASAGPYSAATEYGGYFDNTKCYSYGSSRFTPTATAKPCGGATGRWDGNFLNYITMTKIEIAKWVMMGGKCAPRVTGNCYPGGKLSFESGVDFHLTVDGGTAVPTAYTGSRCYTRSDTNFYVRTSAPITTCSTSSGSTDNFNLSADVSGEPQGIIQQIGTKARFGLMEFKGSGDGGKVLAGVGDNTTSMVNAIENTTASTWTPLAESLYEATRYFAQLAPAYANSDFSSNVTNKDPYYFTAPDWSTQDQYVTCCKSFVIIFTDGQPTQDLNVPSSIQGYASSFYPTPTNCSPPAGCTTDHQTASHNHATVSNHFDNCSIYYGGDGTAGNTPKSDPCASSGSHYLDDVAYWAHTTDLRPDSGNILGINESPTAQRLTGMQTLTIYPFFAFGTGANILKAAAKMGGFIDLDGDGKPFDDGTCGTAHPNSLCKEWDKDGDGVPDTYFESSDAFDLRARLMAAITDILQKSASGTSVSVLATSSTGEGAIYQAYFYPSVFEGIDQISWLGYLQGLFFDTSGQLREDTNADGKLVLSQDKIIETYFDTTNLETRVRRYDVDSNGNRTGTPEIIGLKELKPIWEGGKTLAKRNLSTNPRTIKTWIDSNNNGAVDSGEFIDFSTTNESTLRPYLRAANSTEGTNIINFIHGNKITGYRLREVTVDGVANNTWRLGDIIYSSPVSVGAPAERFDLKNQDSSYTLFYNRYKNRRHVVYVGANDGMLHAFNAGFFHQGDDPSTANVVEHSWFTTDSHPLGDELWAFIPESLLPHLKWLTGTDYDSGQHVYFVDGSPRIMDAQIFTAEAICATNANDSGCIHPGGWGTVLIGSMRLGGGVIKTDLNGNGSDTDSGEDRFRSAYFMMDITNPEATPTLKWVFKDSDLGFTTSWPSVMRFNSTTWYMTVGSGPLTYKGEREKSLSTNRFESTVSEYGQIYVVNLSTGALVRKITVNNTDRYAFMGDSTVYDWPQNYVSDVLYIGEIYYSSGWKGKMFRLLTYGNSDPTTWVLSTLFDAGKPVLAKPTATTDKSNRLWIYFGTGRFFSGGTNSDQSDTSAQALYGIKESSPNGCWSNAWKANCSSTIASTSLLDVTSASVAVGGGLTCGSCGATTLTGLVSNVINSS